MSTTLSGAVASSRRRIADVVTNNRPFIIVWLALFISVIGIAMVSPLLPVFVKEMGANGIWLGLAFSGFTLLQVPLMPVIGKLADRFNKKLFLWLGLVIYTISALGYFWAPGYQELVIFRIFSGIGSAMVMPVAFSYIGELAPYGYEGRYMGLFNIAMIAGFGVGPMLGGVIHDGFGTDATFIVMSALSFLGFLIILFLLPGKPSKPTDNDTAETTEENITSVPFFSILRDMTMRSIVILQMVIGLLFGTILAFIGIWMTTKIGTTVAYVGILLSIRSTVTGIFAYPAGWLADRLNRVVLATLGIGIVVICTFSIPWLNSFLLLIAIFVIMGISESIAMPSISAITVEKGRSMGMGSVMGFFNMAMSLGLFVGSMAGGLVEGAFGLAAVFRSTALLGLTGIIVFDIMMLRNSKKITL
jgi:DHA1 family multidrug resistance protein-like MFS transporter